MAQTIHQEMTTAGTAWRMFAAMARSLSAKDESAHNFMFARGPITQPLRAGSIFAIAAQARVSAPPIYRAMKSLTLKHDGSRSGWAAAMTLTQSTPLWLLAVTSGDAL